MKEKNGRIRSIADSGAPIIGRDNELYGVVLIFRDVTEEKKATEEIRDLKRYKVKCHSSQVQQVFLNILRNGAQAMLENKSLEKVSRFSLKVSQEDDFIKTEIKDNGPGIEKKFLIIFLSLFYNQEGDPGNRGLGRSSLQFYHQREL